MFISVSELFGNQNIYVIPTFQRPYSWEKPQWDDLKSDVTIAANKAFQYHYFAPIHVIDITNTSDPYWKNYTDTANNDINFLSSNNFRDSYGNALKIYLVVDGQQRVTTLYSLLFNSIPSNPSCFVELSSSHKIPRVILNPSNDHQRFRHHLGLDIGVLSTPASRSQKKIDDLFLSLGGSSTPFFPRGSIEHSFLTGNTCELLRVILNPGAKISSFMTLNDRGKDLTLLEKSKSLLMEIDENFPLTTGSNPTIINNVYGNAYLTIEENNTYFSDNEFIKQVAMTLWEGKGSNGSVHLETAATIYEKLFRNIITGSIWPTGKAPAAGSYIHDDVVPAIKSITDQHNYLILKTNNSINSININTRSFVNHLGVTTAYRDAIEDYFNVLQSLKLQPKQLGFLMAMRQKFNIELHDNIGTFVFSNKYIKNQLLLDLNKINEEIHDCDELKNIADSINNEIGGISDSVTLNFTPLQISELLRLIVGNSKSGTFSTTWNSTFNNPCTAISCVQQWMNYLLSWESRDRFIIDIARTTAADNQLDWVKYILREYEYCLSGLNIHRNSNDYDIEHFFGIYRSISSLSSTVFINEDDYNNHFRNRFGNKLALYGSLNKKIGGYTVFDKINPYKNNIDANYSSKEISNDLTGINNINDYRLYVLLRSIRLAAFAAKRF